MSSNARRLLQLALPLVKDYGFSREALSYSVLSLPEPPSAPLNDAAVNALFGHGDGARRTLINAWLDEGRTQMRSQPSKSISDALAARLRYNEPVLPLLPEVRILVYTTRVKPLTRIDRRSRYSRLRNLVSRLWTQDRPSDILQAWWTRPAI